MNLPTLVEVIARERPMLIVLPRADAYQIEIELRAAGHEPPTEPAFSPLYTWTLNGCPIAVADLDAPCMLQPSPEPGAAPIAVPFPTENVH